MRTVLNVLNFVLGGFAKHPKQSNHKHHPFFLYGCKYKQNARKAAISLRAFTIILLLSYSGRL